MAVYTDFFLASDKEIRRALPLRVLPRRDSNPEKGWKPSKPFSKEALSAGEFPTEEESAVIERFERVTSKHLTPDRLEALNDILGGNTETFSKAIERPVLVAPGEFPYGGLFKVPRELVQALATIPQEQLGELAETWLGNRSAKRTLFGLRNLATKSLASRKNLYLWMVV